jgi:endo-1,4-beta-mannosidase
MVDAVEDAEKSGIAFIRFFAHPGYPRDVDMLYAKDSERYWRLMDEVFALCRRHHIRLVPSLGTVTSWHLYCGETTQAILDPGSKTSLATFRYVREFVSRYRDDPTVLMWELENECMLKADVDMKGRNLLPKGVYPPGAVVREKGCREDSLNWAMLLKIYREHAAFIKGLDPNHLVTSGDSHVRPECTSRRETFPDFKYRNDTLQEFLANNIASQPEPFDIYSFHQYGTYAPPGKPNERWGLSSIELYRRMDRAVLAARRPLFIGELGQDKPSFKDDPEAKWTREYLDVIEQEGVPLAALWVWHFPWQPDRTLTNATHPLLVRRVAEFNRKHATSGPPHK